MKSPQHLSALLALALVFASVVGLDQTSKNHAESTLLLADDPLDPEAYERAAMPIFLAGVKDPDVGELPFFFSLRFHYSRNRGVAFSTFANLADAYRLPLFHTINLMAALAVLIYLWFTPLARPLTYFGGTLFLAGLAGNFIDRLIRGYVIDFIDLRWQIFGWDHSFAIFNTADIAIASGLILILIDSWLRIQGHKAALDSW